MQPDIPSVVPYDPPAPRGLERVTRRWPLGTDEVLPPLDDFDPPLPPPPPKLPT